jgi:GNAT superfamily N-acetyltransferase
MVFHRNWIGLFKAMSKYLETARCWWQEDLFMTVTGLQLSVFNAAVVLDHAALTPERLAQISDTFEALSLPFSVQLASPEPNPPVESMLSEHGYIQMFCDPLMVCEGLLDLPPLNKEVMVQHVNTLDDRSIYAKLVIDGFDLLPLSASEFLDVLVKMDEAHHVIAHLEGEPVGAGTVIVADGTAGVYNVTTIASARRRGVGAAIMKELHDFAMELGCAGTALASSAMGLPLYERLGYRHDGYQIAYMPTDY